MIKNSIKINTLIMLVYMLLTSYFCQDGLVGGQCVKYFDNRLFSIQLLANIAFFIFSIYKNGWQEIGILLLNIVLLILLTVTVEKELLSIVCKKSSKK